MNETISITGKAINSAGGGLAGAVAILIILAFIGCGSALWMLWKAYQKLLKESREREGKLLELNIKSQENQRETNEILRGIQHWIGQVTVWMECIEKKMQ